MVVSTARKGTWTWSWRGASALLAVLVLGFLLLPLLGPPSAPVPSAGPLSSAKDSPTSGSLGRPPHSLPVPTAPGAAPGATLAPDFPAPSDSWELFQGNVQRTGLSPDGAPSTANLAWGLQLPASGSGGTPVTAGLVTLGDLLYVASGDDVVYAYDQTNGTLAWTFNAGSALEATPAVYDGLLLVGTTGNNLYELNATNGGKVATIPLGGPDLTSSPLPFGGNVIVPCKALNICEFNLSTQALVWNQTVGDLSASPSYDPSTGLVFVGSTTGTLSALKASTGAKVWSYSTGAGSSLTASPIVGVISGDSQPIVFALATTPGGSGLLSALNESTMTTGGHSLYTTYFADGPSASGSLSFGEIVVPTVAGTTQDFYTSNGAPVPGWDPTPWPGNSNSISASIVDAGGTLLVGMPGDQSGGVGGGEVAEVSATTGVESILCPAEDPVISTPAIDSSAVFFADREGNLYAIGYSLPSSPQDFAAVSGNFSVALSWKAPSSFGGYGSLTQYQIEYTGTIDGVIATRFTNVSSSHLSDNLTGLSNGVTYQVEVAAVNSEGVGPGELKTVTPGAPPYPPQDLRTVVSQNTFGLSWQAPTTADDGGFPISSYTIQYWNASLGFASEKTVTGWTSTGWTLFPAPDFIVLTARVAAVNSVGASIYTGNVSAYPYVAPGFLNLTIGPSAVWSTVSLSISGWSHGTNLTRSDGTAHALLPADTYYWVNASDSGYQGFDRQVYISSGASLHVYVNLTKAPTSSLGLSTVEFALLVGGIVAAFLIGLFVFGLRYRKTQDAIEAASGEESEEGSPPSEGFTETQAKELLQPGSSTPGPVAIIPPSEQGEEEEGPDLDSDSGPPPRYDQEPDEDEDEGPEGAGGTLGQYLERRKAAKETLKSSEEDTPDGNEAQS